MLSREHIWYVPVFILMFSTALVFGQSASRDAYTRVGIAPVIGFYKLNSHHARTPRARMSFSMFIKHEKSVDKKNRMFLSAGAEYLFHGVSYHSYYFSQ